MTKALLSPNQYSRSQNPLVEVKAIVLHWFANPGQPAQGARDYWESRKDGTNGWGAGHVAIDDDETLLCIPFDEIAYHVGAKTYTRFAFDHIGEYPNAHTIGIEMAHADLTGRPSPEIWNQAVNLCAALCDQFKLPQSMIVTHWDVTGPRPYWNVGPCHRWFVEQPGELARFRSEVAEVPGLWQAHE